MAKNIEWVASSDAIARLRSRVPGQKDSELLFAQGLCDGRAKARARQWKESEVGLRASIQGMASSSGSILNFVLTPFTNFVGESENVEVESSTWASSRWQSDRHHWNWGAGIFLLTFETPVVGTERQIELVGVEFDVSELIAAYPKPKIDTRNREKSERWSAWVAQVALMARDGAIKPNWTKDDLITYVCEEIEKGGGDPPMGDGAVDGAAAAVIRVLKGTRPRS